ncbi:MAG: hypothetical protein LKJ25_04495 [Clostridia bacterium]|jgi:hypothetical protein|nr:hypothetical protein [Clostridia bacterium]
MAKYFYKVPEVAKLTGIPAQKIRVNMLNGNWDLGSVTEGEDKKTDYIITPYKLWKCLGICIEDYVPPVGQSKDVVNLIAAVQENTELTSKLYEIFCSTCKTSGVKSIAR